MTGWPRRIICLTSETTEMVFACGAGDRVVGVSGYSVRPSEARKKEKVAAFTSLRMDKIKKLRPDLILGFSDLQKDMARDLAGEGFNVLITNQRSLDEVGEAMTAVGRMIGEAKKAETIRRKFFREIERLAHACAKHRRPRVYFEEWDEPMISGIRWVSDLIETLGGNDIFREKSEGKAAGERTVSSEEVIRANPEIILASWCGKKVQIEKILSRPGWETVEAVRKNQIHEIKSADILAPGLSLIHGARRIAGIFYRDFFCRGSGIEENMAGRKLKTGQCRLYSRRKNRGTGKRRDLGTFPTLAAARKHERAAQFFKKH